MGKIANGLALLKSSLVTCGIHIEDIDEQLKSERKVVDQTYQIAAEVKGLIHVYLSKKFKDAGTSWQEQERTKLGDHWDKTIEGMIADLDKGRDTAQKQLDRVREKMLGETTLMETLFSAAESKADELLTRVVRKQKKFFKSDKRKSTLDTYHKSLKGIVDNLIPGLRKDLTRWQKNYRDSDSNLKNFIDGLEVTRLTTLRKFYSLMPGPAKDYYEYMKDMTVSSRAWRTADLDSEVRTIKRLYGEADDLEELIEED